MNYKSIDWNKIWKNQMLKNCKTNGYKDCALFWEKESAAQYWKMVQETQRERIENTIKGISFNSRSRVLDIGSGPGVLAIPIAKKVMGSARANPPSFSNDVVPPRSSMAALPIKRQVL